MLCTRGGGAAAVCLAMPGGRAFHCGSWLSWQSVRVKTHMRAAEACSGLLGRPEGLRSAFTQHEIAASAASPLKSKSG